MKPLNQFAVLLLAVALFALQGCAPSSSMIATLTMLPGTPTPTRAIPLPTRTPRPTNTIAPVRAATAPQDCPAGSYDTSAPADPSLLPGRSYNLRNLPAGYELVDSGPLEDPSGAKWVEVRWEGRSLFWIQKVVCQDGQGRPYSQIVDALALPRLDPQAGEAHTRECYAGSRRLPYALAFGVFDPGAPPETLADGARGRPLNVQSAWEIGEQFTPLDTAGLTCYYLED